MTSVATGPTRGRKRIAKPDELKKMDLNQLEMELTESIKEMNYYAHPGPFKNEKTRQKSYNNAGRMKKLIEELIKIKKAEIEKKEMEKKTPDVEDIPENWEDIMSDEDGDNVQNNQNYESREEKENMNKSLRTCCNDFIFSRLNRMRDAAHNADVHYRGSDKPYNREMMSFWKMLRYNEFYTDCKDGQNGFVITICMRDRSPHTQNIQPEVVLALESSRDENNFSYEISYQGNDELTLNLKNMQAMYRQSSDTDTTKFDFTTSFLATLLQALLFFRVTKLKADVHAGVIPPESDYKRLSFYFKDNAWFAHSATIAIASFMLVSDASEEWRDSNCHVEQNECVLSIGFTDSARHLGEEPLILYQKDSTGDRMNSLLQWLIHHTQNNCIVMLPGYNDAPTNRILQCGIFDVDITNQDIIESNPETSFEPHVSWKRKDWGMEAKHERCFGSAWLEIMQSVKVAYHAIHELHGNTMNKYSRPFNEQYLEIENVIDEIGDTIKLMETVRSDENGENDYFFTSAGIHHVLIEASHHDVYDLLYFPDDKIMNASLFFNYYLQYFEGEWADTVRGIEEIEHQNGEISEGLQQLYPQFNFLKAVRELTHHIRTGWWDFIGTKNTSSSEMDDKICEFYKKIDELRSNSYSASSKYERLQIMHIAILQQFAIPFHEIRGKFDFPQRFKDLCDTMIEVDEEPWDFDSLLEEAKSINTGIESDYKVFVADMQPVLKACRNFWHGMTSKHDIVSKVSPENMADCIGDAFQDTLMERMAMWRQLPPPWMREIEKKDAGNESTYKNSFKNDTIYTHGEYLNSLFINQTIITQELYSGAALMQERDFQNDNFKLADFAFFMRHVAQRIEFKRTSFGKFVDESDSPSSGENSKFIEDDSVKMLDDWQIMLYMPPFDKTRHVAIDKAIPIGILRLMKPEPQVLATLQLVTIADMLNRDLHQHADEGSTWSRHLLDRLTVNRTKWRREMQEKAVERKLSKTTEV